MTKTDLSLMKKLLAQYREEILALGAQKDDRRLVQVSINIRKTICDINDAEHIKKVGGK